MLLKDRLKSDTRVLFKVKEAIELTGKSPNWFLDIAKKKEIQILYKISTDEVVYCLIPGRGDQGVNNQFKNIDLSKNPKTSYLKSNDYDYAVLTHLHYESVILEGEAVLRSFFAAAVLDKGTKTLKYTHSSSIKDTYQDKSIQYFESSSSITRRYFRNIFRIFKNPTPNNPQKIHGYILSAERPDGTIDTTITIEDLWITRESLLTSAGETTLDEGIADYPWANADLIVLNQACINYHNDLSDFSDKKERLKNFLKKKINEISDNSLDYCVVVVTERQSPRNIAIPSKENKQKYPKCFPYCLINMNEVSRQLYTEHRDKIDNGDKVTNIPSGTVGDKARSLSALPERRITSLVRFMKPNL